MSVEFGLFMGYRLEGKDMEKLLAILARDLPKGIALRVCGNRLSGEEYLLAGPRGQNRALNPVGNEHMLVENGPTPEFRLSLFFRQCEPVKAGLEKVGIVMDGKEAMLHLYDIVG